MECDCSEGGRFTCSRVRPERTFSLRAYSPSTNRCLHLLNIPSRRTPNAWHHPRPQTRFMRGTLMGRRVHAVVRRFRLRINQHMTALVEFLIFTAFVYYGFI